MRAGVSKNFRQQEIDRKCALVSFKGITKCLCQCLLFTYELDSIPILPDEVGNHIFSIAGVTRPFQGQCIISFCRSKPKTFCPSCTRDVTGIVYVCKPSATKKYWNILHQSRCPHPVDQQSNSIDCPNFTRKRKWNSSHGTQRFPRAQKKPLVLNPYHAQLQGW